MVAWPTAKERPAPSVARKDATEICQGFTSLDSSRSVMRRESGWFRCRATMPSATPTAPPNTLRRTRARSASRAPGSDRTACHSSATDQVSTGSRRASSVRAFSIERHSGGASSKPRANDGVTRASPVSTPTGAIRPRPAARRPVPSPARGPMGQVAVRGAPSWAASASARKSTAATVLTVDRVASTKRATRRRS